MFYDPNMRNIIRVRDEIYKKKELVLSKHAEENVLYNFYKRNHRRKIITRKLVLVVIRINANGKMIDSKPCSHCLDMMKYYGVKKVIYSDTNGSLSTDTIKHMSCISSNGYNAKSMLLDNLNNFINKHRKK